MAAITRIIPIVTDDENTSLRNVDRAECVVRILRIPAPVGGWNILAVDPKDASTNLDDVPTQRDDPFRAKWKLTFRVTKKDNVSRCEHSTPCISEGGPEYHLTSLDGRFHGTRWDF